MDSGTFRRSCTDRPTRWFHRRSTHVPGRNARGGGRGSTGILLRDSKDRGTGSIIAFTPDQWIAFLAEVAAGAPGENGAVDVSSTQSGVQVHALTSGIRLRFTPSEWTAFRAGVQDGEFDLLTLA